MSKQKTYVVLGMHRSSTSLIAKALHSIGVNMGDELLPAGNGNPEGHYEDTDFITLNNKLLKSNGGTWDNPPSKLNNHLTKEVSDLINIKNTNDYWGWKDPRTVITINEYYEYLRDPIIIAMFRDPEDVAVSLNKRDGTPLSVGRELAYNYNERLIAFLKEKFTKNK